MKLKTIVRQLPLLLSLLLLLTVTSQTTVAYIIVQTPSLINRFVPGDLPDASDLVVTLKAHKTVNNVGTDSIGPEGFAFLLDNVDDEADPLIALSDINGYAQFTLVYRDADAGKTFTYSLWERDDGRANVTYDDKVYTISVDVTFSGNDLAATVKFDGEAVKDYVAEFENIYSADLPPVPPQGDRSGMAFLVSLLSAAVCLMLLSSERRRRLTEET